MNTRGTIASQYVIKMLWILPQTKQIKQAFVQISKCGINLLRLRKCDKRFAETSNALDIYSNFPNVIQVIGFCSDFSKMIDFCSNLANAIASNYAKIKSHPFLKIIFTDWQVFIQHLKRKRF